MGINNDGVSSHMISLFGEERLDFIRSECSKTLSSKERELAVVQELCNVLKNNGCHYVLPFRFKNEDGTRTSHHLIFLSKNFRGYDIMKDIMYKESTDITRNVASFEYNPRDMHYKQGSLLDFLSRPLEELQDMLLQNYAGQTINFKDLYEEHSVDKPYIRKNYKDVLSTLYEEGKIRAINSKTGKLPRKGSFSDDMKITFGDVR
jgi:hypothetical protein